MNCRNCGAPLSVAAGQDGLRCEYCDSYQFLTDLADSADRIVSLAQPGQSDCPVCETRLSTGTMDGRPVEHCPNCRGILAASDDFRAVVRKRRKDYSGAVDDPEPLNRDALRRRVECPSCRRPMDTHPYYGPGNAVLDSCHRCELIWLDHGELGSLERAPGRR